MTMNSNAFSQSPTVGQLDLRYSGQTVSCQVDVSSAGSLLAGQPVKMVDSAGGVPKVVECAADTDDVFGFINYDAKDLKYNALDSVEISALRGNVMYMVASAAIARNAKLKVVIGLTAPKVATSTSGPIIIGRALDKAAANGDLIRVYIDLPGVAG